MFLGVLLALFCRNLTILDLQLLSFLSFQKSQFHVLLVIFKTTLFLMNFNLIVLVACSFMSKFFTMAIPDSSSMKGASITAIFCAFRAISTVVTGKKGIDLLRKLKQESHESIMPSSSKIFFIPMTRSTLS